MPNDVIQLNLINNAADTNPSQVLIFQKNVAAPLDESAIAWMVIENLGRGASHSFEFPLQLEVGAADSYGNFVSPQETSTGRVWTVVQGSSGNQLKMTGTAASPSEIDVLNGLQMGVISANIYRSGKLLFTKTGVAPGQKAAFAFKPTIWIGVVSQVQQEQVLNSAIISSVNTQLSLLGIASADIVMSGGGPGKSSQPFTFQLQNVQFA